MNIGSLEGLALALLLVVPGGIRHRTQTIHFFSPASDTVHRATSGFGRVARSLALYRNNLHGRGREHRWDGQLRPAPTPSNGIVRGFDRLAGVCRVRSGCFGASVSGGLGASFRIRTRHPGTRQSSCRRSRLHHPRCAQRPLEIRGGVGDGEHYGR